MPTVVGCLVSEDPTHSQGCATHQGEATSKPYIYETTPNAQYYHTNAQTRPPTNLLRIVYGPLSFWTQACLFGRHPFGSGLHWGEGRAVGGDPDMFRVLFADDFQDLFYSSTSGKVTTITQSAPLCPITLGFSFSRQN